MALTISTSENSSLKKTSSSYCRKAFYEGGHDLEKLEFALAVAETRGDQIKAELLRSQISDLGGNIEEPGT